MVTGTASRRQWKYYYNCFVSRSSLSDINRYQKYWRILSPITSLVLADECVHSNGIPDNFSSVLCEFHWRPLWQLGEGSNPHTSPRGLDPGSCPALGAIKRGSSVTVTACSIDGDLNVEIVDGVGVCRSSTPSLPCQKPSTRVCSPGW